MADFRRWLSNPWSTLVLTSAAAVVAAVVKQSIKAYGRGSWAWVEFWQDVVQNGFLAVLLAVATAGLTAYQERMALQRTQSAYLLRRVETVALAISGWSRLPPVTPDPATDSADDDDRDPLPQLRHQAKRWRTLATDVDLIREAGNSDEEALWAYLRLSALPLELSGTYAMEGGRKRRLVFLDFLLSDLAVLESSPDSRLAASAHTARTRATDLTAWVQHTDTTIVERLSVDRVTSRTGEEPLNTNILFGKYQAELPVLAGVTDCLYLLLFHVGEVCAVIGADAPDVEAGTIRLLLDQVRRPLGALRNELRVAAECAEALIGLVEEARRVGAGAA